MARTYLHDTTIERDGKEIDVCIEYSQTPYDSGVSYGPPENCYPPEGGDVEILSASTEAGEVKLTEAEEQKIIDYLQENPVTDDGYDDDYF